MPFLFNNEDAKCDGWFVVNLGFEKMKASPQLITSANLYFTVESLRNVQRDREKVMRVLKKKDTPTAHV